jgi:hypothetical protein
MDVAKTLVPPYVLMKTNTDILVIFRRSQTKETFEYLSKTSGKWQSDVSLGIREVNNLVSQSQWEMLGTFQDIQDLATVLAKLKETELVGKLMLTL